MPGILSAITGSHFGPDAPGIQRSRSRVILLLLSVIAGVVVFSACTGTKAGDPAPDFEITTFENENFESGEVIKLSDLEGQPAVVNFWFPSCPPCRLEMPHFEEASRKYKERGLHFIGVQTVGLDTVNDGQNFVEEFELTYAIGPDSPQSDITKSYKVFGFPSTFFLNDKHEIVETWSGPLNAEKLDELIQEMLN